MQVFSAGPFENSDLRQMFTMSWNPTRPRFVRQEFENYLKSRYKPISTASDGLLAAPQLIPEKFQITSSKKAGLHPRA